MLLFVPDIFRPEQAAGVARFALCAAIMLVDDQQGIHYLDEDFRNEMMQEKKFDLLRLAPERYPRILEAAPYLIDCDSSESYCMAGVDLILGGMRSQVSRRISYQRNLWLAPRKRWSL